MQHQQYLQWIMNQMDNEPLVQKQNSDLNTMTFNIRRGARSETKNNLLAKIPYIGRYLPFSKRTEHPKREWDNRKAAVITMLQQQRPTLFGLQEATWQQIVDLKKGLKDYNLFGRGRGLSWGGRGTNEYTPIFYDKTKLQKQQEDTFVLNPKFKQSGIRNWINYLWNYNKIGLLPRVCTYALFTDKQTQKQFYVFNTHLDHKFASARLQQLKAILNKIKQVVKDKTPVILMGDFNTNVTGEIKQILEQNGFVNTKTEAQEKTGPQLTQEEDWSGKGEKAKLIDHILLKNGESVQVQKYTVLKPEKGTIWSDHYPVIVDFNNK